jgi:ribosomal protein RSM22 (predicted rRNA methylase)
MISFGAGMGGDIIAAKTIWPEEDHLQSIMAVEPIAPLVRVGRILADGIRGVNWTPGWSQTPATADLVCASFAMGGMEVVAEGELPESRPTARPGARPGGRAGAAAAAAAAAAASASRRALVRELWARCGGVLVLVEVGTPGGFECIAEARDELLRGGDAVVLAPCAHAGPCPMMDPALPHRQWCHFTQRHAAPNFQRVARHCGGADRDYLDWRFSYLAVARRPLVAKRWPHLLPTTAAAPATPPPAAAADGAAAAAAGAAVPNWGRIVRPPLKRGGHVVLDMCTADGALERRVVARSHGEAGGYRAAREAAWGDAFPYGKAE